MAEPEYLYHYTSQAGLLGILGGERPNIRATHAYFLNDSQEIKLSLDLIVQVLDELLHQNRGVNEVRSRLLHSFQEVVTERISSVPCFVASFSAKPDSLSQWRGYGQGGPAYALGIPRTVLEDSAKPGFGWLEKCIYEGADQRALARKYVQERLELAWQTMELNRNQPLDAQLESAAWTFAVNICRMAASLKHEGFADEEEWRLISTWKLGNVDDEEMFFREGPLGVTPYIELPLLDLDKYLLDVRIAPNANPDISEQGIHELFHYRGFSGTAKRSGIPFRNW